MSSIQGFSSSISYSRQVEMTGGPGGSRRPDAAKLFKALDANGDGGVTLDEFKAAAKGSRSVKSPGEAEKLFGKIDGDGDGKITEGEIKAFAKKARGESAPPSGGAPSASGGAQGSVSLKDLLEDLMRALQGGGGSGSDDGSSSIDELLAALENKGKGKAAESGDAKSKQAELARAAVDFLASADRSSSGQAAGNQPADNPSAAAAGGAKTVTAVSVNVQVAISAYRSSIQATA